MSGTNASHSDSATAAVESLLRGLYEAFNARDIDAVLAHLASDVVWPNGWEGGTIHGHDAVREYWTRQWSAIDPTVMPESIEREPGGRYVVHVHQVVRDLAGTVMVDAMVRHRYRLRDEAIAEMEIVG